MASQAPDRGAQALQGVNVRPCRGCGQPFTPARVTATHCRPSCRVLALRQRRTPDLFTACADAIEPEVGDVFRAV